VVKQEVVVHPQKFDHRNCFPGHLFHVVSEQFADRFPVLVLAKALEHALDLGEIADQLLVAHFRNLLHFENRVNEVVVGDLAQTVQDFGEVDVADIASDDVDHPRELVPDIQDVGGGNGDTWLHAVPGLFRHV